MAGGLALAAVASVLVAIAVTGGGDTSTEAYVHPGAQEAQPSESPSETPAEGATADLITPRIASYEVFLARDPFEPVVPEPDAGGGGGGTTGPTVSPTGSPTGTPTVSPTGTASPTPTASPSPSGCVADGAVVCDGHTVSLIDVYTQNGTNGAVVQVDSQAYDVGVGDVFASNFRVAAIEPPCATLQYGDDAFTLCEGESVLK